MDKNLDRDALVDALSYDHESGVFRYRRNGRGRFARAGAIAGTFDARGYRTITIAGTNHKAHRLAWLYFYGAWPHGVIDHIDGDKANNAIANLRVCAQKQNCANAKTSANNKSGFKGVCRVGMRWRAQIHEGGQRFHLGYFDTPQEAHAAYVADAERRFGVFARAA